LKKIKGLAQSATGYVFLNTKLVKMCEKIIEKIINIENISNYDMEFGRERNRGKF